MDPIEFTDNEKIFILTQNNFKMYIHQKITVSHPILGEFKINSLISSVFDFSQN